VPIWVAVTPLVLREIQPFGRQRLVDRAGAIGFERLAPRLVVVGDLRQAMRLVVEHGEAERLQALQRRCDRLEPPGEHQIGLEAEEVAEAVVERHFDPVLGRDELIETFQVRYHPGSITAESDDDLDDELEEDDQEVGRE